MRKLKIMEHISLDSVIQHSADDGDFPYSDWTAPYRTPAGRELVMAAHGERFDLLLGRRTYDAWSGFWPKAPSSPMADRLNAAIRTTADDRYGFSICNALTCETCGAKGNRTPDLLDANETRYQLRYSPLCR